MNEKRCSCCLYLTKNKGSKAGPENWMVHPHICPTNPAFHLVGFDMRPKPTVGQHIPPTQAGYEDHEEGERKPYGSQEAVNVSTQRMPVQGERGMSNRKRAVLFESQVGLMLNFIATRELANSTIEDSMPMLSAIATPASDE